MNKKRIIAGIIDYLITCFIQTILMIFFLIMPLFESGNNINIDSTMIKTIIITYCSMSYLIIRDIMGKRSIGKIIMKLKIVNKIDGNESNIFKRLFRNITWLLGPIDIIVFLISNERLGDKIFGTNIIENNVNNIRGTSPNIR